MKNTKLYLIAFVLLIAFFTGGSWAYNTFFKEEEVYTGELIYLKPIDSLENSDPFTEPVKKNDPSLPKKQATDEGISKSQSDHVNAEVAAFSPALTTQPGIQTAKEITRLKAEIEVLRKKQGNGPELELAKQQIEALQQRVDKLVYTGSHMEAENKKLFAVLRHFSGENAVAEQKIKPWQAVLENKVPEETGVKNLPSISTAPVKTNSNKSPVSNTSKVDKVTALNSTAARSSTNLFAIDNIRLDALTVTDNKEIETYEAHKTDKLAGFINIKNISSQINVRELIIVVLNPDGNVMQKSTWESGIFQSKEGRKLYSCKLSFGYKNGENNQLSFSLTSASFTKGDYIMQVYSGGVLIGKIVKKLS